MVYFSLGARDSTIFSKRARGDEIKSRHADDVAPLQLGEKIARDHLTTCLRLLPFWRDQWDHLPSVPPINAKVAVEGEDVALGVDLRHAHERGIRQRHRNAGVTSHEFLKLRTMVFDLQGDAEQPVLDSFQNDTAAHATSFNEEARFRNHRFTGEEWRREDTKLIHRPGMIAITGADHCHERAGIDQNFAHASPKPFKCLR